LRKSQHFWSVRSESGTGFRIRFTGDTISAEARAGMMQDLEAIHAVILEAYKALMPLGGTDLDALAKGRSRFPRSMCGSDSYGVLGL
jgi:hypothetical protein